MHKTHQLHPKYRPDIDGLRAIAVLAVVAFHAFPTWIPGGFIGVDVFFVISGYLISTIIFENLENGTFSFSDFYSRRIRRIFPALILVLVSCYTFGWFTLTGEEYKQLGKHIAAGASFISNIVFWNESDYFDNAADTKPLLHLWSLGIEEQFYIIWPLLIWFSWKQKFNLLTITILIATVSFMLNVLGIKQDPIGTFYAPQTRFWELLSGSILAWITLYKKDVFRAIAKRLDIYLSFIVYKEKQEANGKTLIDVFSCLGLLLLGYGFWNINKGLSFPGYWSLIPVTGAVLLLIAGPNAFINRKVLGNKVAVWFGLISFPLYLWHWPLLSFARIVEEDVPSRDIRIAAVALSIVLSWLTYKLVESHLRFGKYGKAKVTVLVVLMIIVGYVGFNTYKRDGLSFRFKSNLIMNEISISDERKKYWDSSHERNFFSSTKKVVLYGDSQGFDIYKSLLNDEQLGLKIFRVSFECTAFNLAKINAKEKDNACKDSYVKLINSDELKKADIFIYSFLWEKGVEPEDALAHYKNIIKNIKLINPNLRIIFFGPKPFLGTSWASINTITKKHRSDSDMNQFLNKIKYIKIDDIAYAKELSENLNVEFVDVSDIFCDGGCDFFIDSKYSNFDQTHWTDFGGWIFYEKFKHSSGFIKNKF